MTLSYACIAPHGSDVIPELANKRTLRSFEETRKGILAVAREAKRPRPDTLITASPHNLRVHQHIAIATAEHSPGTLRAWHAPAKRPTRKIKCSPALAQELPAAGT